MSSLLDKIVTNEKFVNLEFCIAEIPDPLVQGRITYSLRTIIIIALCAAIGGANDFTAIEQFGWAHCDLFEQLLGLKTNIPSHDTFDRVFSLICPRLFFDCITLWLHDIAEALELIDTVRIDGKLILSLSAEDPLCFVRAWSDQCKVVLEQVKVKKGTNEITTIPEVLERLDLQGKTVTIDAIGTQTKIVDMICENGADYMLALKKNQHQLYDDVSLYLNDIANGDLVEPSVRYYKDINKGHGRNETRECWVVSNIDWLYNRRRWRNLKSLVLVKSTVIKKGISTENSRFYISSHSKSARGMLHYARGHWSIENQLHWQLDTVFCEDVSTTRDVYGIQNIAAVKGIALSLLLQNETPISVKNKRARAMANQPYLMEVLLNQHF